MNVQGSANRHSAYAWQAPLRHHAGLPPAYAYIPTDCQHHGAALDLHHHAAGAALACVRPASVSSASVGASHGSGIAIVPRVGSRPPELPDSTFIETNGAPAQNFKMSSNGELTTIVLAVLAPLS